jgi:hypothetical protein
MKRAIFFILIISVVVAAQQADARRDMFSPEQKSRLQKAERILVEVVAIADKGSIEPGPLAEVVAGRLKEIGYTVLTGSAQPYDGEVKVKCEQRKVWEGTTPSGGDADLPDSPSRVWKGPACQILYLLNGRKMGWQKEVRTEFQEADKAAAAANAGDPGAYAMSKLKERLEQYDFPVLLTAEWGQEERLLKALDKADQPRKLKIIGLFGEMLAAKAVPRLMTLLKDTDPAIAKAAIVALGNIGQRDTVPVLVELLKNGKPELQAAAAKGLGQVGALNGDFSIIPPLIEALRAPDVTVKTEVAWALGKLPDRRSYQPLYDLYQELQKVRSPDDPKMKELKSAVNWSLKNVDLYDQIN